MLDSWRLSDEEGRILWGIGWETYRAWKMDPSSADPTPAQFERWSYLLGIRKSLEALDPDNQRRNRKFIFRRDPRDFSCIWFYDPDTQQYFRIPYRDTSLPPIGLWELRPVRRESREKGRQHVDEEAIFAAYEEMRRTEESSKRLTKAGARKRARRRHHREAAAQRDPAPEPAPGSRDQPEQEIPDIKPFDEVERF